MLISGKEKLGRMRDGRAIYIGAERVDDVTCHPAFKNAAQTIAGLYDLKADPQQRELFSFEEKASATACTGCAAAAARTWPGGCAR
jgi:4-hydroxyphenylacetate 3-monooxygenase